MHEIHPRIFTLQNLVSLRIVRNNICIIPKDIGRLTNLKELYLRNNKDNTSNIEKTEKYILDAYRSFNNINIFLERGNFEYETQGRLQTEEEAKEIDTILKHMLKQNKIPYVTFTSSPDNVNDIVEYIIKQSNLS